MLLFFIFPTPPNNLIGRPMVGLFKYSGDCSCATTHTPQFCSATRLSKANPENAAGPRMEGGDGEEPVF